MVNDSLQQLVSSAESVLGEGLSYDQVLELGEGYSRAVEQFIRSGIVLSENDAAFVLRLHQEVMDVVSRSSDRSDTAGHRRAALKVYLSGFGVQFGGVS